MPKSIMRHFAVVIGMLASFAWPSAAAFAGTTVYANGGGYFSSSGPSQYWHFRANEGYCGRWGGWCSPKHSQWTYSTSVFGGVNNADWKPIVEDRYSRAYAFIPRVDATTRGAKYTVTYYYGYRSSSEIDQWSYYDQWVPLAFGDSLRRITNVSLTDMTFEAYPTKVAFDEIKIEN